jgi:hypothetical protein
MQDFDDVRRKLSGSGFQVVFDINGREAVEAEPILDGLAGRGGSLEQYIYCSSAGVYLKSDMMPHREEDAVDPKSRHKVGGARGCLPPPPRPLVGVRWLWLVVCEGVGGAAEWPVQTCESVRPSERTHGAGTNKGGGE